MKLVSIIIPIYRVEDYISDTVESVLKQTYPHFELIIIDDGSDDNSLKICQQFNDRRIKIITQANQGVSTARNSGIKIAKGEYIAFLDGDDIWLPKKLSKHIEHLENSPKVGISFSRYTFINELGKSLEIAKISKIKRITPQLILSRNPVGNPSCVVMKKEVFETLKSESITDTNTILSNIYFDRNLSQFEDVELWLRIALKTNWKIEGIPEALTLYRVNPKGASSDFHQQLDVLSKMLAKTSSYAPELIAKYGKVIQAYTFRKSAQRAVHEREKKNALDMIHRALSLYPHIILEEPIRTILILGAIYSLFILPESIYPKIEKFAFKIIGYLQKLMWL